MYRSNIVSLVAALALLGCEASTAPPPAAAPSAAPVGSTTEPATVREPTGPNGDEPELQLTDGGVGVQDLRVGAGAEAKVGMRLRVHYVGRLDDGREFDSSRGRGEPFEFELGAGIVLKGWEEGLVGMRVGGIRRLIVPPTLGYGSRGDPPKIPPHAILEFDVELLAAEQP